MPNYLESIELQGLKTFATITRLEFPGRITAIVGPNGSGKSNIADSVRWVLGEQSYSLLRAKRTEDMIFTGSQQRSRAGMASATITFNNDDGWLPIDYSSVSISRRAYRDGQNEYLLNGQRVRLKDISELLSQTGLSERTYTIIGQGLVDVALALKPDERRKLFEEAAGIGLYRSRKEESLRRLENTRKNLDRVLDIMTEIKPRLRSLERQAVRFSEYRRVRSDLQVLLRDWYGFHWHQKQQDLQNVRNAFQDQEKRLSTLRIKHTDATGKVEQAHEQLQANRKNLELAHSESSELHRKLENATRQLAIIDERQRSLDHQKRDLEIDLANVEEEVCELLSQEQYYQSEIDQQSAEFTAAEEHANQIEKKLVQVTATKKEKELELNMVREERITYETNRVQLSARIEELDNRMEGLLQEKLKIEQSKNKLEKDIVTIGEQIEFKETAFQELVKAYGQLRTQSEDLSDRLDEIQVQKQALIQEINTHETKSAKLQAQIDVLAQAEAALSGYSTGSKSVVEDSRKGKLPKGIEPLSKHIIVDEKFERAFSVAIGEFADLLVVPSGDKEVVIEYLEAKANERVALIVLEPDLHIDFDKRLSSEEGVLGYGNELIRVDNQYQDVVGRLFSDIIIVRDKGVAKRIQPALRGTEKAVTLNGLVFQANGVMISGQSASGKRIGRTRQQNEMKQELTQLTKEITHLKENQESVSLSFRSVEAECEQNQKDLSALDDERNAAHQSVREVKDTLARLNEQLWWHQDRYKAVMEKIRESQSELQQGKIQLIKFDHQISVLLDDEKKMQVVLHELPVFEIQQALNHWQTRRIVTQNNLDASQQRFQDHNNRTKEAQQRTTTYQARLTELENGLLETTEKKAALKVKVEEINQAITTIETEQIVPLSSTSEEFDKSISAMQKLEAHSHQQVIIAERHYTQLQLELSRKNDQIQNLRERIEDDFGLVSFDYDQNVDVQTPLPFDDGLIKNLPRVGEIPDSIDQEIKRLKGQMHRMGSVNQEAEQEYHDVKERYEFLNGQISDLNKATDDLREVIKTLDHIMEQDFLKTFNAVNQEFAQYFSRLFNGGEAKLLFSDEYDPVEGGVDIEARLPGRRRQGLAVLSGGERSLAAVALIFALLKVSPTPFCILDEVDAMLDESNVGRFVQLLRELAKSTQFVIITHNRNTVQAADVIYGVTMGRDSTSQMISLKLEDVDETYLV